MRNFTKPRPLRPAPSYPGAVTPPGASPTAGACPGGRVVAQFRKNHVPHDLRPSFPQGGDPARSEPSGNSLPRREGRCAIWQNRVPQRPTPVLPLGGAPAQSDPSGRRLPRREGRCAFRENTPATLADATPTHPDRRDAAPGRPSQGRFAFRDNRAHRRQPAPTRHNQPPSRPLAALGPHHSRRGTPPVPGTPREAPSCPSLRRE